MKFFENRAHHRRPRLALHAIGSVALIVTFWLAFHESLYPQTPIAAITAIIARVLSLLPDRTFSRWFIHST